MLEINKILAMDGPTNSTGEGHSGTKLWRVLVLRAITMLSMGTSPATYAPSKKKENARANSMTLPSEPPVLYWLIKIPIIRSILLVLQVGGRLV